MKGIVHVMDGGFRAWFQHKGNGLLALGIFLLVVMASTAWGQVKFFAQTLIEDESSMAVFGPQLRMENQTRWAYYETRSAPEGGYLGTIVQGQESLPGILNLPRFLQPGTYHVFLKGFTAMGDLSIQLAGGGGSSPLVLDEDIDQKVAWAGPFRFDIVKATASLSLVVKKENNIGSVARYVVRGLYITKNMNEVLTASDQIIDMSAKTENTSTAKKGNIIPNSSFEAGIDATWSYSAGIPLGHEKIWHPSEGRTGQSSMILPVGFTPVQSKLFRIEANKLHTFSVWVKETVPGKDYLIELGIESAFDPPGPLTPVLATQRFSVKGSTWQRFSISTITWGDPGAYYSVYVMRFGGEDRRLIVDDVQFEEGELSDYVPRGHLDLAMTFDPIGHIYYEDEPVVGHLRTANLGAASLSTPVKFQVLNYLNRVVKEGLVNPQWPGQSFSLMDVDVSPNQRGYFRVVLEDQMNLAPAQEVSFSVLPRPRLPSAKDAESFVGIHVQPEEKMLTMLQRMGVRWSRLMSTWPVDWDKMEPVDDQYVWIDSILQLSTDKNFHHMMTLGVDPPAWAMVGKEINLDAFEDYVRDVVTHYKPWVRSWEILNEPNHVYAPEYYARLLKRAVDAIKSVDPSAEIVAMGGSAYTDWIDNVFQQIALQFPTWNWKGDFNTISTHLYPPLTYSARNFATKYRDQLGLKIWNTETGEWCLGAYQAGSDNSFDFGRNLWAFRPSYRYFDALRYSPNWLVKNFVGSIGEGLSRYFYYDSRYHTATNYWVTHPTLLEYDGHLRPKGAAYAVAAHMIDFSTVAGPISISSSIACYQFYRDGKTVLALWTIDDSMKSIQMNLPGSQWALYDVMGNAQSFSANSIPVDTNPIYLVGTGVSTSSVRSAVVASTVAFRFDRTPPLVQIIEAPRSSLSEGKFVVRYLGMDENSIPSPFEYNVIEYSTRLVGHQSAWSSWNTGNRRDFSGIPAGEYLFEVKAKDAAGNQSLTASTRIIIKGQSTGGNGDGGDGGGGNNDGPDHQVGSQSFGFLSFKNVFNPSKGEVLRIRYSLPTEDHSLSVRDRKGIVVRDLKNMTAQDDGFESAWDGRNDAGDVVSSGSYVLILKSSGDIKRTRVIVVK